MTYSVDISPKALKFLERLREPIRQRLFDSIDQLETNPRPLDCKKLVGEKNGYRIRVGDYRIIYDIYDKKLLVMIVKVGHRKDVYRGH